MSPKLGNPVHCIKSLQRHRGGIYGSRPGRTIDNTENQPCKNCMARKNDMYFNKLGRFFYAFCIDPVDQKIAKYLDPHGVPKFFRVDKIGVQGRRFQAW